MKTVRFGPFVLDDDRRLLLEGGRPVHLSPKAYQLLALLVERSPAAVSKVHIRDRLWPDTFVADSGLAALVNEVRRAIGECARSSRAIRTVHGYGYAFDGDVIVEPTGVDGGADRASAPSPPAREACTIWLEWNGRQFALGDGEHTIGRSADVEIPIDVATVSKHHARIVVSACEAFLEDVASKNGTFLNGTRLAAAAALRDGDDICLGDVHAVFHNLAAPGDTVTVRE